MPINPEPTRTKLAGSGVVVVVPVQSVAPTEDVPFAPTTAPRLIFAEQVVPPPLLIPWRWNPTLDELSTANSVELPVCESSNENVKAVRPVFPFFASQRYMLLAKAGPLRSLHEPVVPFAKVQPKGPVSLEIVPDGAVEEKRPTEVKNAPDEPAETPFTVTILRVSCQVLPPVLANVKLEQTLSDPPVHTFVAPSAAARFAGRAARATPRTIALSELRRMPAPLVEVSFYGPGSDQISWPMGVRRMSPVA
jgi:hypothetical protein